MTDPNGDGAFYRPTDKTRLHRIPERGSYDKALVASILAEALICHVAFADDGQPMAIPTTFAHVGEVIYVHGAAASRMVKALASGARVGITVTLLDGLVLARSGFHHSMNYRSVVVLGVGREVTDAAEKARALDAIVERVGQGRSRSARGPNEKELRATRVVAIPLEEVSAKVRTGGPIDEEEDMRHEVWAGTIPLRLRADAPIVAADLAPEIAASVAPPELPEHLL